MAVNVTGGALEFDAVINDSQFGASIRRIEAQLQGLTATAEKEAHAISDVVTKSANLIALIGGSHFLLEFFSEAEKVREEYQKLEIVFRGMLRSKEEADSLIKDIGQLVAKSPFSLTQVADAARNLVAFKVPAKDVTAVLTKLGDISIGTGASLSELTTIYTRVLEQGKLTSRELLTLTNNGVPIIQALADQFGVSKDKVNELVTAGKVGFPQLEKAISSLTGQGGIFFHLMEDQSQTISGQIHLLKGEFEDLLNELGKNSEGTISAAISGLRFLVEHFGGVIDIIKVLVITYGAYRAAIIATNIITAIAVAREEGLTVALFLKAKALQIAALAQNLLNKAMLANPTALVIAGVAGIIAALTLFGKKSTDVKSKADLLAEANEKVGESFANQEAKIRPYLDALKGGNVSEQERLNIYNKLKEIDPKIIAGLDAKTLSYKNLSDNVNKYLDALRNQFKLEANKEAVTASIKQEQQLQKLIDEKRKKQEALNKEAQTFKKRGDTEGSGLSQFASIEAATAEKNLIRDLEEQKKITQELGETQVKAESEKQVAQKRTIAIIDEEIKVLKKRQTEESVTNKQFTDFQKQIIVLEEEKKKITGASKSELKALQAEENRANAFLEERRTLLEKISDLQKNANQSGFQKTQTELDKINERYDDVIDSIDKYNRKVDEFNKKSPKNQVQKIGQTDILALNKARTQELDNTRLKEDADRFKKSLDDQKRVFEQFEEAKKQIGIKKSTELFADQLKGNKSFLELLQNETERLLPKVTLGIADVGEKEKLKAVLIEFSALDKKNTADSLELQKQKFVDLLTATSTFKTKEAEINKRFNDLENTLKQNSTIDQFDERKKLLEQGRQDELNQLKNDLARASDLYRRLNQDILLFTRERLKEELKLLKDKLKTDTSLSPQQKQDIQNTIEQYKGLLDSTNKVSADFKKAGSDLGDVSGIFHNLGGAIEDVNAGMADTLNTIGDVVGITSNLVTAIGQFASGDILGAVSSVVSAVVGIFSIGKKVKESRRQAQAEIDAFTAHILSGEIAITEEYRQRQREQAKLNQLKLQGLLTERKLLQEQKQAVQDQYNTILAQIQAQSFVADEVTKKFGGVLGIGRKTKVVEVFQSLAGKSFEDLEKLFAEGRLVGKGKELFELLQKIKSEGADIDSMLAENAAQAKEIFTGTTIDSLVNSIADGFANGLHSAGDFAGKFEDLMRNAMINALKFQFLEGPLNDFLDEFSKASQSDNVLTSAEIDQLQTLYNSIINNASAQFDQLQQISGLNLSGGSGSQVNSITGAIKGMTETQAELLAGQFGGLRLTALDHLQVGRTQLATLNAIQVNTGTAVIRLADLLRKFDAYETGASRLKVDIK